ncbi:ribonuclease [Coleophoma cylindrospora]|uniref:Ribonuclease n=1 Tax=Coleophoma cylindrospora TaxID=1849047 RepID=A0A3D8SPS0_9HELO|nr:ribonuclease [Coleophoma cylindrospora]
MEDSQMEDVVELETAIENVFMAPSVDKSKLFSGRSYTHYSAVPATLLPSSETEPGPECCLGVDEAGRGPVLGPMVYGLFYLPLPLSDPLLKTTHHFDDSKVLTAAVRSQLMEQLCTSTPEPTDLYTNCGWAVEVMSARDIGANMLKPAMYNLNAQAMDSTIALIQGVLKRGVNVKEIYIDTIGSPEVYQKKLERIFPTARVTVAKKADSLYPCVSAASVCAKVTRDSALEVLYSAYEQSGKEGEKEEDSWGSGYPSDARCVSWLKRNMDPVFGWGAETRFSWGTVKDLLELKSSGAAKVDWPANDDGDDENSRLTDYFSAGGREKDAGDELAGWFGMEVGTEVF